MTFNQVLNKTTIGTLGFSATVKTSIDAGNPAII